jgi:plasmid maintenance system antidote protein VapI
MTIKPNRNNLRDAAISYQQAREIAKAVEILTAEFPAGSDIGGVAGHIERMRADVAELIRDAQERTTPAEFAIIVSEYPR